MSREKHTPGPWAVNSDHVESAKEHGWANDGWIIAKVEGPDFKANALLIASAPDLLSALKERTESACDTGCDSPVHSVGCNEARAAIRAAEEGA